MSSIFCFSTQKSELLEAFQDSHDINSLQTMQLKSLTFDQAYEKVKSADALYISGSEYTKGDFKDHPTLKAAESLAAPIILENFSAEAMAEVLGFGIDAELACVQMSAKRQEANICILKHKTSFEWMSVEGPVETVTLHSPRPAEVKAQAEAANLSQTAPEVNIQPAALVTEETGPNHWVQKIKAFFAEAAEWRSTEPSIDATLPPGRRYAWNTAHSITPPVNWRPFGYDQGAFINVYFQVTMVAADDPTQNKYLSIKTLGNGMAAVSLGREMEHDEWLIRGAFQENLQISYGPMDTSNPAFIIQRNDPKNNNNTANLTSTTGFTVGASGGGSAEGPAGSVDVSYSQSNSVSQDIRQFKVVNSSSSSYAWFDFSMSLTGDNTVYNEPADLIEHVIGDTGLHSVPTIAKNVLEGSTETVWILPPDYAQIDLWTFNTSQTCRCIYRDRYDWATGLASFKSPSQTMEQKKWYFAVDFSKVHY